MLAKRWAFSFGIQRIFQRTNIEGNCKWTHKTKTTPSGPVCSPCRLVATYWYQPTVNSIINSLIHFSTVLVHYAYTCRGSKRTTSAELSVSNRQMHLPERRRETEPLPYPFPRHKKKEKEREREKKKKRLYFRY